MRPCRNAGCDQPAQARGRCWACYRHLMRHGTDRDMAKVEARRIRGNQRRLDSELADVIVRNIFGH